MATNASIGWIGIGRMGYAMAERLAKSGADLTVWNRTRSKAEPLAARGAKIAASLPELAGCEIVFCMVSTWDDVKEVVAGPGGLLSDESRAPKLLIECSSISLEGSAELRALLAKRGVKLLAAPVSGNAKVIKAGKLSAVASGPEAAFRTVGPMIEVFAPNGVSYVGEGELARVCKIAHNVMLGVVIENLIEITLLANKMGVPRHAFLAFMNNGVMGSMFTRYKSPALVNLDWTTTFTPQLLRKDLDLGLGLGTDLGVPMPVTAAAREVLQQHFGAAQLKPDPEKYLAQDFAALLETMAIGAGVKLKPENKQVPTGLE